MAKYIDQSSFMECKIINNSVNNNGTNIEDYVVDNDDVDNDVIEMYRWRKFDEVRDLLNSYKSQLDIFGKTEALNRRFLTLRNSLDHFRDHRKKIERQFNTEHVSNAWLKMYEILREYKMFDDAETLTTFHNAEFPGSFILATKYYIANDTNIKNWTWWGSSFVEDEGIALKDSYQLYKKFPDNWLMNETYNGDVTSVEFQKYIKRKLNHSIDFYTADLGFGVSDENNQETAQAHANLGQIMSALLTIKTGGGFLTKQYTMFEPFTISLIIILSQLFEDFRIIKPATSRAMNSETYLFGRKYIGMSPKIEKLLMERLINFSMKPLMQKTVIKESYKEQYEQILSAMVFLAKEQSKKIAQLMELHKKFTNIKDDRKVYQNILSLDLENKNKVIAASEHNFLPDRR
jgi:23S rRNA U2552 (ribose-2'-O)-methylase RlmE/FtsJ